MLCAQNAMYVLLLYTRTAVVVAADAHNAVPGINGRCHTHDDIREEYV